MKKRPAHKVSLEEARAAVFKMDTRKHYGQDTERKIEMAQRQVARGVSPDVACDRVFGFVRPHLLERIKSK